MIIINCLAVIVLLSSKQGVSSNNFASNPAVPHLIVSANDSIKNLTTEWPFLVRNFKVSLNNSVAIDFDWKSQRIYWSENKNPKSTLNSAHFSGKNQTVLFESQFTVDGIAVDWYGSNLYWSDVIRGTIEVSNLNGQHRRTLIKSNLIQKPRAIALSPAEGLMYYSEWGDNHHIGRANMDGSDLKILLHDNLYWPNSLTLEHSRRKLYWADALLDYIGVADLPDLTNRKYVTRSKHPFAMDAFQEYLYVSDWEDKTIHKINVDSKEETKLGPFKLNPCGLKLVYPSKQEPPAENPCENNGGCSQLCVIGVGGKTKTCMCSENHYLVNEKLCVSFCGKTQFECKLSMKCLPHWKRCDGKIDCSYGEDELECGTGYRHTCHNLNLLPCRDTVQCVRPEQMCDGVADCKDSSDEQNCDEFDCSSIGYYTKCRSNNKCIPVSKLCDGVKDCPDGQDEKKCEF